MASKYLIQFRGRHIFNPSNFALVLAFVILGSSRVEPLQFWWGPMTPALLIVLLVIVAGALLVLSRVGMLAVAVIFWFTFATALGILALSGHAFTANWHLGPVADYYFWKVLILSPEVFIFLAFMITDPRTAPETPRGRRIYALAIGLLGALLIAPMQTEYWAKVALLVSLTIVCAARPVIILAREALERREPRAGSATAPAAAGPRRAPRRRRRRVVRGAHRRGRQPGALGRRASPRAHSPATSPSRSSTPRTSSRSRRRPDGRSRATRSRTCSSSQTALGKRDATQAAGAATGAYLAGLKSQIAKAAGRPIVVPSYHVDRVDLQAAPGGRPGAADGRRDADGQGDAPDLPRRLVDRRRAAPRRRSSTSSTSP